MESRRRSVMSPSDRPFYSDPWKGELEEASRALWNWRDAVRLVGLGNRHGDVDTVGEAARLRATRQTDIVDADVLQRVLETVDRFGLEFEYLAMQLESSERLAAAIRFDSMNEQRQFIAAWVHPHARLLAGLAKVSGPLYVNYVDSFASAFFLLGHLMELRRDLERDHFFIPTEELSAFGVDDNELRSGPPSESVKKLLWKQCVRIRDYFARALPLSKDLPRTYRVGFRRWWLGGLEVVNAIEKRKYDVWRDPVELSRYQRAQARFQARFARISFGHK